MGTLALQPSTRARQRYGRSALLDTQPAGQPGRACSTRAGRTQGALSVVRGLDVFREYFAGHADQFVLIGGTAATLAMEEAGLEFRATKDLDIVLHIEALSPSFGDVFWRFIEAGRYEIRQASDTGKPVFYRFQKPADDRFPVMLELFCRAPEGIKLAEGSHLTPIPVDEAVASLSAIL